MKLYETYYSVYETAFSVYEGINEFYIIK